MDIYDLDKSPIYTDDPEINRWIRDVFIECMGDDEYMLALDYNHSCYRYNPRITTPKANPTFMEDAKFSHGGYYAYFPEFYPKGDYFLFVAKDFSWGYFTHPWRNCAWVHGEPLMKKIQGIAGDIGFVKTTENKVFGV